MLKRHDLILRRCKDIENDINEEESEELLKSIITNEIANIPLKPIVQEYIKARYGLDNVYIKEINSVIADKSREIIEEILTKGLTK